MPLHRLPSSRQKGSMVVATVAPRTLLHGGCQDLSSLNIADFHFDTLQMPELSSFFLNFFVSQIPQLMSL